MSLVKSTSSPKELREIATGLNISWVGKSNEELADEINKTFEAKIAGSTVTNLTDEVLFDIQPGETKKAFKEKIEDQPQLEESQEKEIVEEETQSQTEVEDQPLNEEEVEDQPTATQTSQRTNGKWYEQEDSFPYQTGQKIEIVKMNNAKHNFLVGRFAVIQGPSTKKNALKAQLIHPTTGKLQKTNVTFNFDEVKVISEDGGQKVI